ncbi:MAG: thermonuclease family protein [Sandaracinaceae bacterium]
MARTAPTRRARCALLLAALALAGCVPVPRGAAAGGRGEVEDRGRWGQATPSRAPRLPFDGALRFDDDGLAATSPSALPAAADACRPAVLVRVLRVRDGDTLEVEAPGEPRDLPVRLIGVDTPELHPARECLAEEARAFSAQLAGHLAWLAFDRTCHDSYGRLLAYVHVGREEGGFWQRQLLRRGLARVLTVGANRAFAGRFGDDEGRARAVGAGRWGACP